MLISRPMKFVPVEEKKSRRTCFEIYSFGMRKKKIKVMAKRPVVHGYNLVTLVSYVCGNILVSSGAF